MGPSIKRLTEHAQDEWGLYASHSDGHMIMHRSAGDSERPADFDAATEAFDVIEDHTTDAGTWMAIVAEPGAWSTGE